MKQILVLGAAMFTLSFVIAAQQQPELPPPPEAYPGQAKHEAPPADFFCRRQTVELDVPPQQACTCERMYSPSDGRVMEDQHCTVYCWPDSCLCGIGGTPMTPRAAQ